MLNRLYKHKKGIIGFFSATFLTSSYFYDKHQYEKELYGRMVYLMENNVELSGVYLQQRQAFGMIGYFQWLIPYHQSLKIVDKETGQVRHVGLGGVGGLNSEFVLHDKEKYAYVNSCESSIPIECNVDYFRKTGHFPENVNANELNKITITSEENKENLPQYKTIFGSIINGIDGQKTVSTCNSAILWALSEEEKRRIMLKD